MVLGEQRLLKSCIFKSFLKEGRGSPQPWQSSGGGCTTGEQGMRLVWIAPPVQTRCQMTLTCRTQQTTGSVGSGKIVDIGGSRSSWGSDGRVT